MPGLLSSITNDKGALRTTSGFLTAIKSKHYQEIIASDPGGRSSPAFRGGFTGFRFSAQQVAQSILSKGSLVGIRAQSRFIIDNLTKYTEASVKLAVLEAIDILINSTPIDTTWASHSWFPGIGSSSLDNGGYLVEPGDEGESNQVISLDDLAASESGGYDASDDFYDSGDDEFGDANDPAAAFLRANDPDFSGGTGEIISIDNEFKLQSRQAAQKNAITKFSRSRIFVNQFVVRNPTISNNVPYIAELNEGKSRQTPRNFVGRGIIAGLTKLELRTRAFGTTGSVGGRVPRISG